jgi:hypothetical protein
LTIHDLRERCATRLIALIGTHGNEGCGAKLCEQLVRPSQLRAPVIHQRRFVALHSRARTTGEDKTEEWRTHGGRRLLFTE